MRKLTEQQLDDIRTVHDRVVAIGDDLGQLKDTITHCSGAVNSRILNLKIDNTLKKVNATCKKLRIMGGK